MTPLLTRDVLDVMLAGLRQADPGTPGLALTQTCHPDDGITTAYTGERRLVLRCRTCQREVASLPTTAMHGTIPPCHPAGGVEAVYTGHGLLTLRCHTCQEESVQLPLLAGGVPISGTQEPLS